MDVKTIKAILRTMRNEGCLKLEMPELKVELVPHALLSKDKAEQAVTEESTPQWPSQEEIDHMVFYSAPQVTEKIDDEPAQ